MGREIVAMNSRVVLKARPEGLVKPDAVEIEEVPISVLQPGQCLVKTISLGVDAFIRTMMDAEAYHGSIAIGGMVPAFGVGTVIGSECPEIGVGTVVSGMLGAQTHAVVDGGSVQPIPAAATRPTDALGPLAMTTGLTAWVGINRVTRPPAAGDVAVVSAASGAVGQIAAQILVALGCRVIGITGGDRKCQFITQKLKVEAVDYKNTEQTVSEQIKAIVPDGVDFFYDNVGGAVLDEMLLCLKPKARVVICGAASQYSGGVNVGKVQGPTNYLKLAEIGCSMHGFNVMQYPERFGEGFAALGAMLQSGQLVMHEHELHGLSSFGEALCMMFSGNEKLGKLIVHVKKPLQEKL